MTQAIVDTWLARFVNSALAHDLDAHMAMIAPDVLVFGVPGFETLEFADWYRQCEHEFPQGLLTGLTYDRLKIRTAAQDHVLFKALETSRTRDGNSTRQAVEMLIRHDAGSATWKLKQMRLLPEDEARRDGLI
ncbi:MAG: nuclear transport factor 2 family protein [Chromatiaceae bacterium]|jgi:hypothetical protein|nr:nuclear transport factor 2 family protein [Chromatiaceae bacterium]